MHECRPTPGWSGNTCSCPTTCTSSAPPRIKRVFPWQCGFVSGNRSRRGAGHGSKRNRCGKTTIGTGKFAEASPMPGNGITSAVIQSEPHCAPLRRIGRFRGKCMRSVFTTDDSAGIFGDMTAPRERRPPGGFAVGFGKAMRRAGRLALPEQAQSPANRMSSTSLAFGPGSAYPRLRRTTS